MVTQIVLNFYIFIVSDFAIKAFGKLPLKVKSQKKYNTLYALKKDNGPMAMQNIEYKKVK